MKRFNSPVFWTALALAMGCASHPQPHVTADLSAPKPAAVSFFRAVAEGDVRTARDASIGTRQDKEWIDVMSSLLTGLRRYDEAIVKRFGHEARQTDLQLRQALLQLVQD